MGFNSRYIINGLILPFIFVICINIVIANPYNVSSKNTDKGFQEENEIKESYKWDYSINLINSFFDENNIVVLTFTAPPNKLIWAILKQNERNLDDNNYTFVEQKNDVTIVKCFIPEKGNYTLSLVSKNKGEMGSYTGAINYSIHSEQQAKSTIQFPEYINNTIAEYIPNYDFNMAGKVQPTYNYSSIDSFALNVPSKYTQDIKLLTNYLIKPAKSDLEKIRAIFRWITDNISYDTESYFSGNIQNAGNYDYAFKNRKSVCSGYGGLFAVMAGIAGVKCVEVPGYAVGYGYSLPKIQPKKANHSWNAVEINGLWYLLDATWGAGYVGNDKIFVKEYDEYYFLTPPENLIFTHFPFNVKHQLLINETCSWYEFINYPNTSSFAFKNKIQPIKEYKPVKYGENTLLIKLLYAGDKDILLNLTGNKTYKKVFHKKEIPIILVPENLKREEGNLEQIILGFNPKENLLYLKIYDCNKFIDLNIYIYNTKEKNYKNGINYKSLKNI
ncbi:MAG: transglutaminase domain-containing protein [bacterium]